MGPTLRGHQNQMFCPSTLSTTRQMYPLERGCFLCIHAPVQCVCLFVSPQACVQKRILCQWRQSGTNHKLQWNSWLWVFLAITRGAWYIHTSTMQAPDDPCETQSGDRGDFLGTRWKGRHRQEEWLQTHDRCDFDRSHVLDGDQLLSVTGSETRGERDTERTHGVLVSRRLKRKAIKPAGHEMLPSH